MRIISFLRFGLVPLLVALTGLGFYYVATEAAVPILRWTHVAAGAILPLWLALHIARGRRATGRY